jgi:hexosaminidase
MFALASTLGISACTSASTGFDLPIIPRPRQVLPEAGDFELGPDVGIVTPAGDAEATRLAHQWAAPFRAANGWEMPVEEGLCGKGDLCLRVAGADTPEGYRLHVTGDSVVVTGNDHAGLFYGLQTLDQALPPHHSGGGGTLRIPSVLIDDAPRFHYRGMHLDVGRHFFGPDFVKEYIDHLARYKINRFHWHLTEDQGWRIEIERYPRLTEVAAWRPETIVEKNFDPFVGDGTPHGGFYTQDEVREIVAYAQDRYVTIVPEIEMPGHSLAALAAYPDLACTEGPFEVGTRWGVFEDIYCPKEETFEFLTNVLTEVMELFPGEYIHIGGDEAPKARWETSDVAQAVIQREGLEDELELQSWFIGRIEAFLNANGRRLLGWDEILEGGLAPNATVMSWRGVQGGIEAARQGHDVIMTPTSHLYLDYYQGDPETEPLAIGGYLPLETVYGFEPIPEELTETEARHVIGAQGNVWTEYMKTEDHVEYMVFPRMMAVSEVTWSDPTAKNFRDFVGRLPWHLEVLDEGGVRYRIPDVVGLERDRLVLEEEARVELSAPGGGRVHYTLDGSEPTPESPAYSRAISLDLRDGPATVSARAVLPDGRVGPARTATFTLTTPRPAALVDSELEEGVRVDVYEGRFRRVADLDRRTPIRRESMPTIGLLDGTPEEEFGLRVRAYLAVPLDGVYTFRLTSDDGAVLRFAGTTFLDHDNPHVVSSRTAQVALAQGLHPIEIAYFQVEGGKALKLEWSADGETFETLGEGTLWRVR